MDVGIGRNVRTPLDCQRSLELVSRVEYGVASKVKQIALKQTLNLVSQNWLVQSLVLVTAPHGHTDRLCPEMPRYSKYSDKYRTYIRKLAFLSF